MQGEQNYVEKRIGLAPVPQPIYFFTNARQRRAIAILSLFGWSLICVRRENCYDATPLLWHPRESCPGTVGPDGVLTTRRDIRMRFREVAPGPETSLEPDQYSEIDLDRFPRELWIVNT